jgi:hypothetical protein
MRLAQGGEVRHFYEGDYVDPMGSAPVITDPNMGTYQHIIPGSPESLLENKQITPEQYKEIKTRKEAAKAPPAKAKEEAKPDIQTIFDDHNRRQQANPEKNIFAEIFARNEAQREENKKSAAEDRNLALLAAGLGIMGGTSPYAFANIGQGAMKGVEYLGASKARRASEMNALSASDLKAMYYGEENKRKERALSEGMRDRDLDNLANLEKTLQKQYFIDGMPRTPKQEEAYKNALMNSPLYQILSRNAGINTAAPSAPVLNYNLKTRSLSQ